MEMEKWLYYFSQCLWSTNCVTEMSYRDKRCALICIVNLCKPDLYIRIGTIHQSFTSWLKLRHIVQHVFGARCFL